MAAARPLVSVFGLDGKATEAQLKVPAVLTAPIRSDIVHFVHTSMAKNKRQAYSVMVHNGPSGLVAGHQHSAKSWGTGRAVARIPRVSGGGTHRAGQAAFGNMCRGGRMFAPTKVWRKWHIKINQNQRRFAVVSALAASALPALVMARGHKIDNVSEVPLVVSNDVQSFKKTKQAVDLLKAIGAYADVEKVINSKKMRAGKGKMRGRRYTMRRGPLIVYKDDSGIVQAFRNLPGVEVCQVERLNLLQLAPGSHMGRFIIWTQSAFEALDGVFGTFTEESKQKNGYKLPQSIMTNSDLTRIINSDEVQSKVRPAIKSVRSFRLKKNPLKNLGTMVRLNPYATQMRRTELLAQEARARKRADAQDANRK